MRTSTAIGMLLLACAAAACHKEDDDAPISTPTVANRAEMIRARDSLAQELVQPGDTLTIYVFILIDEQGNVHQPEVKQEADQRAIAAAIQLVNHMHFHPAMQNGKPHKVLMKIPVRFARPPAP